MKNFRFLLLFILSVIICPTGFSQATDNPVFRTGSAPVSKLTVRLLRPAQVFTNESVDLLVAQFSGDFSKSIFEEDSYKLPNPNENIAIDRDGKMLSLEGRPDIVNSDTLPLRMWQLADSSYLLKLEGTDFNPALSAVVRDNYLNHDFPVNLGATTLINFSLNNDMASKATNRFTIIFRTYSALPVAFTKISGYQKDKGIQVTWSTLSAKNIDRYEVERSSGQVFYKVGSVAAVNNGSGITNYDYFDADPSEANFYRIKIVEKSGAATYSATIKLNTLSFSNSISFYPNPVVTKTINVQFDNKMKGNYTLTLVNTSGQPVFTKIIDHSGGSSVQTISINNVQKGIYTAHLENGSTKANQLLLLQ